jgi:hypothetical protein
LLGWTQLSLDYQKKWLVIEKGAQAPIKISAQLESSTKLLEMSKKFPQQQYHSGKHLHYHSNTL